MEERRCPCCGQIIRSTKSKGYPLAFRNWLKRTIYRKGYSLSGVSQACETSKSWLDMVVQGRRKINPKQFRRLEVALGLTEGTIEQKLKKPIQ